MTELHPESEQGAPTWRSDVNALAFRPDGHRGTCMMHRHAFRTLLRRVPSPDDCAAFFHAHIAVFQAAARAKIARAGVAEDANFHLTSRDLARAMRDQPPKIAVARPVVLG